MIRATFATRPTRALCWDLENRPSAYWVPDRPTAQVTAIGWKWRDKRDAHAIVLLRSGRWALDDGRTVTEKRALELFRSILVSADTSYGHNLRRHDLPLFQTALWRAGAELLPELRTTDTLRDIPKRKDMSASLENLAKLYDLGGDKLHMSVNDWEQANRLDPGGVAATRARVISDVLLQERLRDKLLELGLLSDPKPWRPK